MNGVTQLLTYRYALIIQDLNVQFCARYINKGSRTFDQMIQAARSGKQNIVEGVDQNQTSKRGEIKLLGVAKASFEELLTDYEDFLRQNNLLVFPKTDPRISTFRRTAYVLSDLSNLSDLGQLITSPQLPENPTDAANFLLTLCHIETFLLHRQIAALMVKFEKEGGITEKLYALRQSHKVK